MFASEALKKQSAMQLPALETEPLLLALLSSCCSHQYQEVSRRVLCNKRCIISQTALQEGGGA
jgi:hypothetical protein